MRTVRFTYPEPQLLNSSPGSPGAGGTFFFVCFIKEMWLGAQGNQEDKYIRPVEGRE